MMRKYTLRARPHDALADERAHRIVLLARDGLSERAITRAVRCGRNTVRRVLAATERSGRRA